MTGSPSELQGTGGLHLATMVLRTRPPSRIGGARRSTLVSADSKMHQFPVGKGTTLGTLNAKDWMGPAAG